MLQRISLEVYWIARREYQFRVNIVESIQLHWMVVSTGRTYINCEVWTWNAVGGFTRHQTERKFMSLYRYVERIANVRWELKDLGMEHNGYAISSCRMCIFMVCSLQG
jgi:hypothetical protein